MKNRLKIKDVAPRPSEAIRAMIQGLKRGHKLDGFKVHMSTYGSNDGSVCFGCAATCALSEISQGRLSLVDKIWLNERTRHQRASEVFDRDELEEFEAAIDDLRFGCFALLLDFYLIPTSLRRYMPNSTHLSLCSLDTSTWKENLHYFEEYLEELLKVEDKLMGAVQCN